MSKRAETAAQKEMMGRLSQQAVGWLVGVTTKLLRDHQPDRNSDGTYDGRRIVEWLIERKLKKARAEWERSKDSLEPYLRRQAEARAIKLEAEAMAVQGSYMRRDEVEQLFREMASAVRQEMEAVAAQVANDLPEEIRGRVMAEIENHHKQCLRRLANRGRKSQQNESANGKLCSGCSERSEGI